MARSYTPKLSSCSAQLTGHFLLAVLLLLFQGCSTDRQLTRTVGKLFRSSAVMNDHHVGFALSDPASGVMLFEKNADKLFIPASNTKLFTFYAVLKMLPDSIPGLRYIQRGDSLIFWGTGDPSFLQSRLKGHRAADLLRASSSQLFFAAGRYTGDCYGTGWSWDDYNDYYQAEITELPLMDNLVTFSAAQEGLRVMPSAFRDSLRKQASSAGAAYTVNRSFHANTFFVPLNMEAAAGFVQQVPYRTSTALTLRLLSDTLHRQVQQIRMTLPDSARTIYNASTLDVLREMLLPSDNFIAEQLLLSCCTTFQSGLNTADAIRYITEKELKELPDAPRWVDGSGLSRMNLFSPRDLIWVLRRIDQQLKDRKLLFSLLPAGGKAGTLKNAYPATEFPFVYGKTGTFSNNYNQSGYLLTKKGRTLTFSFMNNNFAEPVSRIKTEMTRMITYIHDHY